MSHAVTTRAQMVWVRVSNQAGRGVTHRIHLSYQTVAPDYFVFFVHSFILNVIHSLTHVFLQLMHMGI